MSSQPTIKSAIACKRGTSLVIQCLIENNGTEGMTKFWCGNYDTEECVLFSDMFRTQCVENTRDDYITELWHRTFISKVISPIPSKACLATYNCISGDDCDTNTCTTYNPDPYSTKMNLSVPTGLGNIPEKVKNLTATPGDESIRVKWDEPGNAPIFAYWIYLKNKSTEDELTSGYVNRRDVTITHLTNGTTYTILIRAYSDDMYISDDKTIDATPVAPPPIPSCSFTVT